MKRMQSIKAKLVRYFGIVLIIVCLINGYVSVTLSKCILEDREKENLSLLAVVMANQIDLTLKAQTVLSEGLAGSPNYEAIKVGSTVFSETTGFKGETIFTIETPIRDSEENIIGGLMGIQNVETFTSILEEASVSDEFMGLDSNAIVVAHSDEEILRNPVSMEEMRYRGEFDDVLEVYEHMLAGKTGVGTYKKPETGESNYLGYAPIGDTGRALALIQHKEEVMNVLNHLKIALFISTSVITALGLVGIYILAKSIAKRMCAIATYLENLAQGEFEKSMPKDLLEAKDETGKVARAVARMKVQVEDMLSSIKRSTEYMNEQMDQEGSQGVDSDLDEEVGIPLELIEVLFKEVTPKDVDKS